MVAGSVELSVFFFGQEDLEPAGVFCVIGSFHLKFGSVQKSKVGAGDHPSSGIASWGTEGTDRFQTGAVNTGFFQKFPAGSLVYGLIRVYKAAGKCKLILVGRFATADEKYLERAVRET